MKVVLGLVMVSGCVASSESIKQPPPPPRTLDEFQLDYRATQLAYLNEANTRIGPTCAGKTMPVTLGSFDQGTSYASLDARHVMATLALVCACEAIGCDEPHMTQVRQGLARALDDKKRDYREGVNALVSGLANSSCLDSTVAGELFQRGYVCAFDAATSGPTLRRQMETDLAKYVPGPPGQATELAAKCWNSVIPPALH